MKEISPTTADSSLQEFVSGIARQHTRVKMRNNFGVVELGMEPKLFHKDSVIAEPDKKLRNLLQEQPGKVKVTLLSRVEGRLSAYEGDVDDQATLSDLFKIGPDTRGAMVTGRKAKLFVYWEGGMPSMFINRVVIELDEPAPKAAKPKVKQRVTKKKAQTARVKPKISSRPGGGTQRKPK